MEASVAPFEKAYWEELNKFLEEKMPAFEGFTEVSFDAHALLWQVELFLAELFESMGIKQTNSSWHYSRAAYWIPDLDANVGFYWWWPVGAFRKPRLNNAFCVEPRGQEPLFITEAHTIFRSANESRDSSRFAESLKQFGHSHFAATLGSRTVDFYFHWQ